MPARSCAIRWAPACYALGKGTLRRPDIRRRLRHHIIAPLQNSPNPVCVPSTGDTGADAAWVAQAVQRVTASLHSGSAKVQWNACHAAGQALRSAHLRSCAEAAAQLAAMLDGLLEVLSSSTNFKSRVQAAAALEGLSAEHVTVEQRERAAAVLSQALESVQGRASVAEADASLGARTASGSHDKEGSSTQTTQQHDVILPSAQRPDMVFSELRYRAGLLEQLQTTLERLQALKLD